MKQIEAIVRPERLDDVAQALDELGLGGLTVTQVKGHGSQGGVRQMWRGKEYVVDLLPKTRVLVVVPDADVDRVVAAIVSAARTGHIGDGKIFVSPAEEAVRVRTGEHGAEALLGGPDVHSLPHRTDLVDAEAS